MKVIVTGGNGFLGRHICDLLSREGHFVSSFSRKGCSELEKKGIKTVQGDITNIYQLESAFEGQDAVIHTAGHVSMWGKWKTFENINIKGTRNVINACKLHHIKKLVYTSSPSVVFGNKSLNGVDETQEYPKEYLSMYGKSKAMAEKLILEANNGATLCTTALRPHLIYGPGDTHLVPRIINMAKSGKLKIIGKGKNKVDVIHVKNAAYAHFLALENLKPYSPICGKAYFLGQEKPVILWDFINKILKMNSIKPVKKKVPFSLAYGIGAACEKTYEFLNKYNEDPPMTRFVAMQLAKSHYFSHENAQKDLGYRPIISIEESLQ